MTRGLHPVHCSVDCHPSQRNQVPHHEAEVTGLLDDFAFLIDLLVAQSARMVGRRSSALSAAAGHPWCTDPRSPGAAARVLINTKLESPNA
jgi:hypothetical protein